MDERAGLRNLRYLKWIGIVAPVVFLVALEAVHLAILDPAFGAEASNLLASGLATVAAVGFGLVLFFYIEDSQRTTVQQNRDMGVINAVSLSIQGKLDVEEVMQAALDAIVQEIRPTEASIHLPVIESVRERELRVTFEAPDRLHKDGLSAPEQTVEIPLEMGHAALGHLRLTVPVRGPDPLPSPGALRTVGNHVGAALQIGQLVEDLQRRRTEGHTLYQALLQIGNQAPLWEIVTTLVAGSRDRLQADSGRICLTEAILNDFQGQQDLAALVDGDVACICPEEALEGDPGERGHRCRTRSHGAFAHVLAAPIVSPGERFGELWVARGNAERPFGERDRAFLMTLAGLAAIAVTGARLRERERQGATLAERDRIARELHDSLAQVLGSTHLRLRALLARPEVTAQTRTAAELTDLADVAEEAYRDVREAILGLREASRSRGLLESLAAYLEKYTHQSGIRAVLETTVEDLALPTDSELQVIRVIQEALTNVRKHARASSARIRVASGEPGGNLTIVIEDDGRGFDPSAVTVTRDGGFGVQTMRERIELVGGTLRVDSAPGRGTKVIAMVPMPSVSGTNRAPQPDAAE